MPESESDVDFVCGGQKLYELATVNVEFILMDVVTLLERNPTHDVRQDQ